MKEQVLSYVRDERNRANTAAVVVLWLWSIGCVAVGAILMFMGGAISLKKPEVLGPVIAAILGCIVLAGALLVLWGSRCGRLAIGMHRRDPGAGWRAVDALEWAMWTMMLGNGVLLAVFAAGMAAQCAVAGFGLLAVILGMAMWAMLSATLRLVRRAARDGRRWEGNA